MSVLNGKWHSNAENKVMTVTYEESFQELLEKLTKMFSLETKSNCLTFSPLKTRTVLKSFEKFHKKNLFGCMKRLAK